MDNLTGSYRNKFAVTLVLVLVGVLSAGCGMSSFFGVGGGGSSSATPTKVEPVQPETPKASDSPSEDPIVTNTPAPEVTKETETAEPVPQDFVGEIELSVEGRPGVEEFFFAATECLISPTRVNVVGQGIDLSTGEPSTVVIDSVPLEELGETKKYGVFQAAGAITVSVADEEYVSDGRMHTVGGHEIPSMFTYRLEEPGIKYAVSWWTGATQVSAGYVKVSCKN